MELHLKRSRVHLLVIAIAFLGVVSTSFFIDILWITRFLVCIASIAISMIELYVWWSMPDLILIRADRFFVVPDRHNLKSAREIDSRRSRAHAIWIRLPKLQQQPSWWRLMLDFPAFILYRDSFNRSQWCALKRALGTESSTT